MNEIQKLQLQIDALNARLDAMNDYSSFTLEFEKALLARGFTKNAISSALTGIVKANGLSVPTAISGITGNVFVASTNGGSPTTQISFTDGVRTA